MWEVFRTLSDGGIMMFINCGVSIAAVAIVLMRIHALWFRYTMSAQKFADEVVDAVSKGEYGLAVQRCARDERHPLTRVARELLVSSNLSDKEIERAYEDSASRELPRFKRYTSFLPQAGNLGTLIGLLGTIHGLIEAFGGASAEDAAARQQILAKGITIAFYNTFFGLSIAVFCALTFIVINGRQGMLLESMESAMNRIRSQILKNNKAMRRQAAGGR